MPVSGIEPQCAEFVVEQGERLFGKRLTLMSLWQEISNNFYVERADFTVERVIGITYAENLMTSYPLVARRDLGNAFGAMLRPTQTEWFDTTISREDRLDDDGRVWLAYAKAVMRRAMYDRGANFARATKEADHDYAAFGQAVIQTSLNRKHDALLFRNWHLRDVAWAENAECMVDTVHRRWKPYARDAAKQFPRTAGETLKRMAEKDPYQEVELRHVVMPSEDFAEIPGMRARKTNQPFVSLYLDATNNDILEYTGGPTLGYVIPRWLTVSGSQYAYSPATVAALPDSRLLQAITLTLLEAGERFTNPPMLATQNAIRSDVQLFAGGITWVDAKYDERLGEVLRPLTQDRGGMPLGSEMRDQIKATLKECFYLDALEPLPEAGENPEMTAFEVGQRVQKYIRQAMPLFEPMEIDYNGALCEETFGLLLRNGAFGRMPMPRSLAGQAVQFKFISPLSETLEAQKGQKLAQAKQMLALVADIAPEETKRLNARVALKDALLGNATPPAWLQPDSYMKLVDQHMAQQQQMQQTGQVLAGLQQSANIAQTLGQVPGVAEAMGGQGGGSPAPAPAAAPTRMAA